jgi:hypothetical protein
VLPSLFVLGLAALAALLLVLSHPSPPENVAERRAAARALALAVGVQSVHFAEQAATGFHERLGGLAWPARHSVLLIRLFQPGVDRDLGRLGLGTAVGAGSRVLRRLVPRDCWNDQRHRASALGNHGGWVLPGLGELTLHRCRKCLALAPTPHGDPIRTS